MKSPRLFLLMGPLCLTLFTSTTTAQTVDPAYTALPWERTGGPVGGLGYDIRHRPSDPNVWYVTDAWAGIHMSTDKGQTWFPTVEGIEVVFGPAGDAITIFSATVDPHEPDIIWIGTQHTAQIFKSTDGGYRWTEMSVGIDPNLQPLSIRGFTVDPRASEIVYAMAEIGSPGWTSDGSELKGLELDLTKGIVYKTTDGGAHWTEIWRGDNLARYCWIDPGNPQVLYVSTGIFDREAANTDVETGFAGGVGILKSEDGGATWRTLGHDNGLLDLFVGSLYMHPVNPEVLLAAASQNNWSGYGAEYTGGIYRTEDGGESWDQVLVGELFSAVEFCTSDPDVAYAGSINAVYRSDDGGNTWQRFGRADRTWGSPGLIAGMPIDMQCDPTDPMRIFVNNYLGGNFLSTDGGQTWISASKGYTGALVRHVVVASNRPSKVYAGSRSGVHRSDDSGTHWRGLAYPPEGLPISMNEITALAVDPTNPDHLLASPADISAALYSNDGGQSWHHAAVGGTPSSLVFAPSDPSTVYAALNPLSCEDNPAIPPDQCGSQGKGVFVSRDGGVTWNPVAGAHLLNKPIQALAVHPRDPATVYAAPPSHGISKTTDGGGTWMSTGTGLPELRVLNMAIDPSDPDALFAGLEGGAIYKSVDGGMSWFSSSAGLDPNAIVQSVVVDPTNSDIVYSADFHSGVYLSTDAGATWQAINDGLDHKAVNVLALSDDGTVLYAGVEGAGVYRLGDPRLSGTASESRSLIGDFRLEQNYPNPFKPETVIRYSLHEPANVRLDVLNILGHKVATIVDGAHSPGSHEVRWRGLDRDGLPVASGLYLYRLDVGGSVAVKRMMFVR